MDFFNINFNVESLSFAFFAIPVFVAVAVFFGLFLFWRECKHELVGSEDTFDITIVSIFSALVFSRIFEFIFRYEFFGWSFSKLFFFNVFPGADFWGAIVGTGVGVFLVARQKKLDYLHILDLGSSPMMFFLAIVAFGSFAATQNILWLLFGILYLFAFFVIKRLATKKRHVGFFAGFFLVAVSVINLALFPLRENVIILASNVPYELVAPVAFLVFGAVSWYVLAKRSLPKDIKGFFAGVLLLAFKTKRVVTSIEEADSVSKVIILSPYYAALKALRFLKYLGKEVVDSFSDLLYSLGVRR